ncbi:MAG TPA: glycosyltransferase family 1 protein [Candidatus Baltobacteraceae bacterium]|nr:glycosyltransferase family 1 protein [Candidatus Baltobacteraceae bacterium]
MLSVGVDAWNLPGDHRGIGRYLRAILHQWHRTFADRVKVTLIVPELLTWTVRSRYRRETNGENFAVVSRALHGRAKLDVLWFPWNGCSWTNFTLPAVATLHDATNFAIPGYAPQTQVIFRNAVAHCRSLITDSVFSATELARELSIPLERLTPVPLGVDLPADPQTSGAEIARAHPYVLFVGTAERRKGVDILVRAMDRVQRHDPSLRLVIAGSRGDGLTGGETIAMETPGFIDDRTLAALYRDAELFAFPSRYEGFGLPVLEAMAHGTPVITTRVAAIPEVAGDAALYVPPDDDAALADAIARVRGDAALAASLRERGRLRAAAMPWTQTAERTLEILEQAAS